MSNLDKIDHVVVLMLENRSFDNLLGWLDDPDNPPPFNEYRPNHPVNGVVGKDLSNPIPSYAIANGQTKVPVGKGTVMVNPNPDPGEEWYHINTQVFGTVLPESNRFATDPPDPRYRNFFESLLAKLVEFFTARGKGKATYFKNPFNLPDPVPAVPPMNGFVTDYVNNFMATQGRLPKHNEYQIIMDCFTPDKVPVLSTLAQKYAVCDSWHCSVPSQTFCNRSFAASATSNGFVVNAPYVNWLYTHAPTIFNRLAEDPRPELDFRVYFDEMDAASLTFLMQPATWKYRHSHFQPMQQFIADAAEGKLPAYSFIEPRLMIDHNDMHPPIADPLVTSSVLAGELLIRDVYEAVRNSPLWEKTLLIITFDEHGGCYDHVPPPAAVPPDPAKPAGQYGFRFDRLGVRVPAVLVSPWIDEATVVKTLFDHTSIIKTITTRWGLPGLTERDAHANHLGEVLSRSEARQDRVEVQPRPYTPSGPAEAEPLHSFQRAVLALVAAVEFHDKIDTDRGRPAREMVDTFHFLVTEGEIAKLKTVGEGIEFMQRKLQPKT